MKLSLVGILFLSIFFSDAFARGRGHGGPQFTDEQKSCLQAILGAPGEGSRPSHEEMKVAAEKCGIEAPPSPPEGGRRGERRDPSSSPEESETGEDGPSFGV